MGLMSPQPTVVPFSSELHTEEVSITKQSSNKSFLDGHSGGTFLYPCIPQKARAYFFKSNILSMSFLVFFPKFH